MGIKANKLRIIAGYRDFNMIIVHTTKERGEKTKNTTRVKELYKTDKCGEVHGELRWLRSPD